MIQSAISLDRYIFHLINNLPHNFLIDNFFATISGTGVRIIAWYLFGMILFTYEGKKDRRGLLAQFIAVIFQFLLVSLMLKNYFQRLRPEFTLPDVLVIYDDAVNFSFPSSHAAFAFSMAYILSRHHGKFSLFIYSLAFLVALSRIYLGKHYPVDVLVGMGVGTVIGWLSLKLSYYIALKFDTNKKVSRNR